MYSYLTGTISFTGADYAVLDVAGVGYHLSAGSRTLGQLEAAKAEGKTVRVHTYVHVREDILALFGFADAAEKSLFLLLTSVNGLGPKLGLSMLSTFAPEEIITAIQHNQPSTLARASGVGKKLAEKIILELKDKLGSVVPLFGNAPSAGAVGGVGADVLSALLNLGYPPKAAEAAVASTLKQLPDELPDAGFAAVFKAALKTLAQAA